MTTSANGRARGKTRNPLEEVPPHNEDAELSTIGSIILDGRYVDAVAERLSPDDFRLQRCAAVYREMLSMRSDGVPIDATTLADRLKGNSDVSLADLAEMADSVPTAGNAAWYAQIVRDKAEERRAVLHFGLLAQRSAAGFKAAEEREAWRRDIEALPATVFRGAGDGGIDHGWLPFAEFMAQDVRQSYLVSGVVPEAQGGIISGRFKTLKTSIALDLFISMATGAPFLGRFGVPAPVPCALMTAEAGAAAVIGTAKRIAAAKGVDYRDGPHLTTACAKMTEPRHLQALERHIERHGWRCVGIDPTYLAFADVGSKASNVFEMGAALEPLTGLIQRTGCTIILLNHNTKGRAKDVARFDPPDLAEISMSGFAEWMRFWLLLAQTQDWDEATGTHKLWLRIGGSAGHAGLHGLTVTEGEHDEHGRRMKWEIGLSDANETKRERETQAVREKARRREQTEADHVRKLADALTRCPAGETEKQLSTLAGLNKADLATALASLLKCSRIEQCGVTKRGQVYDGYRLAGQAGQGGTNGGTVTP